MDIVYGRYLKIIDWRSSACPYTSYSSSSIHNICCAYNSSMTWKAASNEISEIKKMLMTLSAISSYYLNLESDAES